MNERNKWIKEGRKTVWYIEAERENVRKHMKE